MIQVLEGDNAIAKNRELMGATNPQDAAAGTIRADFADSIAANAVHGSDAPEPAAVEIAYFFPSTDVYVRCFIFCHGSRGLTRIKKLINGDHFFPTFPHCFI